MNIGCVNKEGGCVSSMPFFSGSGIYFLCHNEEVVYCGMAMNIAYRIGQHTKDTKKTFNGAYYISAPPNELRRLEYYWVQKLTPRYNINLTERAGLNYLKRCGYGDAVAEQLAELNNKSAFRRAANGSGPKRRAPLPSVLSA